MGTAAAVLRLSALVRLGLFLAMVAGAARTGMGQESGPAPTGEPPRILTSELQREQVVEESELEVHFVFADSDAIQEVMIDGVPESIQPWSMVLVTRRFHFEPGLTEIVVMATDEAGNRSVRRYLVAYQAELPGKSKAVPEPAREQPFQTSYQVSLRYEIDDNPTTDLSVTVPIGDLDKQVPAEGYVSDSRQSDQLWTLGGVFSLVHGDYFALAGMVLTDYAKSENDFLESETAYGAVGYQFGRSGETALPASLVFTLINVGGVGYALMYTANLGHLTATQTEAGGTETRLYNAELTYKDFQSELQTDGFQLRLKWEFSRTQPNGTDSVRHRASLGTNDDGLSLSNYRFAGWDSDWRYGWPGGYLLTAGTGVQYRDYPNDKSVKVDDLGNTRLDLLTRINIGVGWQINAHWSVMLNDDTFVNISNDRPYRRSKYGFILNGAF